MGASSQVITSVMLVPEGGEIEVDVENLSEMGIVRVVSFLDLIFTIFLSLFSF